MDDGWFDMDRARPFLRAAEQVLNAYVLVVLCPATEGASFEERIAAQLAAPSFADRLDEAVRRDDPREVWHQRYQPSGAVRISQLDARAARARLTSMLTAQGRFMSPYGEQLTAEAAAPLVDGFLAAFDPAPTELAEVDPSFLRSWGYLDGFCDAALALGANGRVALLLNNGTD